MAPGSDDADGTVTGEVVTFTAAWPTGGKTGGGGSDALLTLAWGKLKPGGEFAGKERVADETLELEEACEGALELAGTEVLGSSCLREESCVARRVSLAFSRSAALFCARARSSA